jgi:homoserine kinase type II
MAVYTEVPPAALDAFLEGYAIGQCVACTGIQEGVENSNYRLDTTTGRYILTIYEKRVDPADLPFFLALMDHLAARGVACPVPIHGRDGRTLRSLCGKPATIVSFLDGRSTRRITPERCRALGAALGELHLAGQGFPIRRANALSVGGWRPLALASAPRADEVAPGLAAEILDELAALERDWPRGLPEGVIHADLFPDNAFFEGDRVTGVIDFYFASVDTIVYDVAVCLNAWCFEADGSFNITKARQLLQGYRSQRPLSAAETAALPILCRGAALRFLLTRLYDWLHQVEGALVRPQDPLEYLRKLRFHRIVDRADAYGLD